MRIRHPLGLLPKNLPGLRPFRNREFVFTLQHRHLNRSSQRSLRDADRNRAIEIGPAPLEKRVLSHFEKNIQVARRPAIRAGFALARHSQTRARIHSRRNADVQSPLALDAALSAASNANVANRLPRALARRASPRNREKSLLISQLPVPVASASCLHPASRFRSGTLTSLACLMPRDANLCVHSRGRFFERQRHVVPQILPALPSLTAASAPSSAP